MTQAHSNFAAVFIDSGVKYEFVEENVVIESSVYVCGCGKSFPSLYDLVEHESQMHFIEFSRSATKLKSLIDEFILPDEKRAQKVFKTEDSPEYCEPTIEWQDDDSMERVTENTEETEIIRRLQESGQVSLKIKKKGDVSRKLKKEVDVPLKEKIETVSFRKIVSRTQNRRKPHSKSFTCPNCPLTFDKYSLFREHERTHKFICHFCGRNYSVKLNLKMHIFREHKGVKTFCSECGIQTINLAEHMKKHQKDPTFMCDLCGKEMRGRQRMNNHMNRAHKSRFARFFCKHCNAGFRYMADLNEHSIKHEPDRKDHKCPVCEKAYKRRNEMRRHWQSHSGQKFPCLDCGREYAFQRGLWTHKKKGFCKAIVN